MSDPLLHAAQLSDIGREVMRVADKYLGLGYALVRVESAVVRHDGCLAITVVLATPAPGQHLGL